MSGENASSAGGGILRRQQPNRGILKPNCGKFLLGPTALLLLMAIATTSFFPIMGTQSGSAKERRKFEMTSHQAKIMTFRSCYADFVRAIEANPTALKHELYTAGLITDKARNSGSADAIADSYESKLKLEESKWDKLIEVLPRCDGGGIIAEKLMDQLEELLERNAPRGDIPRDPDVQATPKIDLEFNVLFFKLTGPLAEFGLLIEQHKIISLVTFVLSVILLWIAYKYVVPIILNKYKLKAN